MNKAQALAEARKLLGKGAMVKENTPSKYLGARLVGVKSALGAMRIEGDGATWAEAIESAKRRKELK